MSEKPPVPAALQTLLLICETEELTHCYYATLGEIRLALSQKGEVVWCRDCLARFWGRHVGLRAKWKLEFGLTDGVVVAAGGSTAGAVILGEVRGSIGGDWYSLLPLRRLRCLRRRFRDRRGLRPLQAS
jgi:hypothetical protein